MCVVQIIRPNKQTLELRMYFYMLAELIHMKAFDCCGTPFHNTVNAQEVGGGGDLTEYWIEIHWGGAKRWSGGERVLRNPLGPINSHSAVLISNHG